MNSSRPTGNWLDILIGKAADLVKGVGFRLLVHLISLYGAVLAGSTAREMSAFPLSGKVVEVGVYLGLICLVPRGISITPGWVVPTVAGLVQVLALSICGMPWQMATFWGGLQTWLMRLLQTRAKMGWEWVVSPFLAIVMLKILVDTQSSFLVTLSLCALPVGFALGWTVMRLFFPQHIQPNPLSVNLPPESSEVSEKEREQDNLKAYRDSAWQLEKKKFQMPKDTRSHLEGIRRAVDSIVDGMRDAPEDKASGEQFLQRYLSAAHKVVDEYIRLAKEGGSHQNVAEALAGTKDLLARLEKAFVDEHGRLLQNDALNFAVELSVLDKLLTMQGR